jgi:ubiquinone/menaquinone biosynthesis C-methylase UbiE
MSIHAAKLNKNEVVQVYSRIAPLYDLWQLANIQNGESVLEVAVGTGLAFHEIVQANQNGKNHGIDLTESMLAKARQKISLTNAHYQLEVGDAYNLEFKDAQFDLVVNNYMFDLLTEADFTKVLTQFKRVLKPGGRLVLVNMTRGEHFYQRLYETLYQINPSWMGGCRGVLLSDELQKAGFKNISREMISQLGFPSEVLSATL